MKRKAVFRTLTLGILIVFQEALFRIVFPLPEVGNFNRVTYADIGISGSEDSVLASHKPISNARFFWNSAPDHAHFVHTLNLYGFRDRDWHTRKSTGVRRVAFVGDSFVEGFMAADGETISDGYAHAAKDSGIGVEAMNFGIGGTGIQNYLPLIRDLIPIFRPDELVLVIYANDLPYTWPGESWTMNPLQPQSVSRWVPRMVQVLTRLIHHEPVPARWKGTPRRFVPAVPDPASPWTQHESDLSMQVTSELATAMKAGDFNPFVPGSFEFMELNLKKPFELAPMVASIQKYAARYGTQLRVVYVPLSDQVTDHYLEYHRKYSLKSKVTTFTTEDYQLHSRLLRRDCEKAGIEFLDTTPILKAREDRGIHNSWNYDEHMKGESYLSLGGEIFKRWPAAGGGQ